LRPGECQQALRKEGIEPPADENNDVQVIHNDIASFTLGTVSYFVQGNSFSIETTSAPWIKIVDMIRAIFGERLVHTPVTAFGINRSIHFRTGGHQARHDLGREMAPIEPWGWFGTQLEAEDRQLIGGMTKLVMTRKSRIPEARVSTNVTLEPSARIAPDDDGVYVHINSHHAINSLPDGQGCKTAIDLIVARFDEIAKEADQIFDWIMTKKPK